MIAAKAVWIAVFVAGLAGAVHTHSAPADPVATVRALNIDLLSHDGATEVLGRWCAAHHLADPPVIRALRDRSVDKPADLEVRSLLRIAPGEAIRYRRVRLVCGAHVLSNADNWYVSDRLTSDMNRRLDHTDTPFGIVAKPIGFHRIRLSATPLLGRNGKVTDAVGVLRHKALLADGSGVPFSLVIETYTPEILGVRPSHR